MTTQSEAEVEVRKRAASLVLFDGQRPAFEEGNTAALKHGVYSKWAPAVYAQRLAELAVEKAPALAAFPLLVDQYARTYAVVVMVDQALDTIGVLGEDMAPRSELLKIKATYTRLALQQLREMGLTRKVAAELQLDIAQAAQAAASAMNQAGSNTDRVKQWLDHGVLPPTSEVVESDEAEA